ncbi:MAG: XRE family transcriptional regulator [Duncaniella sp.]|nr:XRE family transcriptional regulator [Duncaniella sp.]
MKRDAEVNTENEPVNIGKIIEEELRRQERSVTWLSRKLHCDRRNVYDIFTRQYIDTGLLFRISEILSRDFFVYFSNALHMSDSQQITPPAW